MFGGHPGRGRGGGRGRGRNKKRPFPLAAAATGVGEKRRHTTNTFTTTTTASAECTSDTCANPVVAKYLEELSNDATAAENMRANARKAWQSVLKYPPVIRCLSDALELFVYEEI